MDDVKRIADYCMKKLDLANAKLSEEFFYQSLSLCVIDAVFSVGVNYTATRNTVIKYCQHFNLKRIRDNKNKIPSKKEQQSISNFLSKMNKLGIDKFTEEIFDNRQLTSPSNGILKSKAVYQFTEVLREFNVDYFQDINKIIRNYEFKKNIKSISGQKSGISLNYFFMLAGFDNFIKPDRMVLRFLQGILKRKVNLTQAQNLLIKASDTLKKDYNFKSINPKLLDYQIWKYESKN
ncbi:hypothetical protein [Fuchsiella alkaliacetigena]|uniref:hypothetical protein n=1 Tax=Fuchsiella alkaliacetigena TaxID=957042 RepID=UPI00200A224A|nr:hypothetical protein [Fuchsiella alkaliacetigena]MCK8825788.1 hypothetical protein [Fuchsiella alkaliacetigena]